MMKIMKSPRFVIASVLGTIAFNAVMYVDIAVTGMPMDITKTLGTMLVGKTGPVDLAGHTFHFANGMGLAYFTDTYS